MPPKGWKAAKLESSLSEAAEWKKLFFASKQFDRVEDLLAAAGRGEMAKVYVEAFLELGHRPRKRRTISDVVFASQQEVRPHWLVTLLSSLWLVYSTERNTWKEVAAEEATELANATRTQRQLLRGTGMVRLRRPNMKKTADKRRAEVLAACGGAVYCMWVDNYNKFRYSRNPNEDRDRCINATVFAMLPQPGVRRQAWSGWPTLSDLQKSLDVIPRQMVHHHKEFADRIRVLYRKGLRHEHVRVPCDLRRFSVTTVPWVPFMLQDADIKSTAGLVKALQEVLHVQRTTFGLCCMLMDVNIFYRVLRLVYCQQFQSANVLGALPECVPMLGVWHAYAHSLKKVYEHFLPWWAALEVPAFLQFPEQSVVYCRPKLIVIEHLVMGLFLAASKVEDDIRTDLQFLENEYGADSVQAEQCRGLLYLCTEYCPALVEMGIAVRQCFWATQDVNTGESAKSVLRDATVLLQTLSGGVATEYIRSLMLMDALWTDMHGALPAACFVEECLESSLSVLTRRKQTDTRATTVAEFSDMYNHIPVYFTTNRREKVL